MRSSTKTLRGLARQWRSGWRWTRGLIGAAAGASVTGAAGASVTGAAGASVTGAAGVPTASRTLHFLASVIGVLAGTAAGAIGGPVGAFAGALLGGVAGAVAGRTLEAIDRENVRTTERLDRDIGIIDGSIGASPEALARASRRTEVPTVLPSAWFTGSVVHALEADLL